MYIFIIPRKNKNGDIMFIAVIRTVILYTSIIIAVRLMGKRQISELQTSELVVTMLISDIASIAVENTSKPLLGGLIPMTVLVVCEILISAVMIKSPLLRKLISGSPIVVIAKGKIVQHELKRLRMSVDELSESLRQQDVFSFDEVMYAIVETNGQLSIMKKPEYDTPSVQDLKLTPDSSGIEAVVISDGAISDFGVRLCGTSKEKVTKIVDKKKYNIKDVFIMTMNEQGQYTIVKRSDEA